MTGRLFTVLAALAVGATFAAGLFVKGRAGGGLLLVTTAILIVLTRAAWPHVRPQGRPLRVAVIVAILVFAIVKIVG